MRKLAVVVLALAALLVGSVSSGEAWTRGDHFRGGHFRGGHFRGPHVSVGIGPVWGPGIWWGWPGPYWSYPYPYYAPPVVVQQEPPVYIQQSPPAAPQPEAQQYWYYCEEAKAYYPYVQQCPKGWMTVVPTPPPGFSSPPGQ